MIKEKIGFFIELIIKDNKIALILYLIILTLFRIPPFYIVPVRSFLYSSHTVASLILLILFAIYLIKIRKNNKKALNLSKDKILLIVILFFFSQSLSILSAFNIVEFIRVYKNIVLGVMFFIVSLGIINDFKKIDLILKILIGTTILNFFIQLIIYFKPLFLYSILSGFLYDGYWKGMSVQAERNRYFIEFFDGALIPLMFYFFIKLKQFLLKLLCILLIFLSYFLALISNFRIELVVVLFTTICTIFLFKNSKRYFFSLMILVAIFLYIGRSVSISFVGYSSFERLLLEDKEDTQTIINRIYYWKKAVDMGKSSPIFGIGLGNYYDYFSPKNISTSNKNEIAKMTLIHPHNVFFAAFAETGIIGLIAIISLFGYFFISDYKRLKMSNNLTKLLIFSFWSLFISSLTGPRIIIQYIILFWILRAVIEKNDAYFPP